MMTTEQRNAALSRPYIPVRIAGTLLGLSDTTAYKAARAGDIPTVKLGGRKLVPTAKLREMLGATAAA